MPDFRMPSLGADMDSGTLLEWLVKPGDAVHRGDVIAVIDTDKAAIEAECFEDGVVEQLIIQPGQRVAVGTVLATVGGGLAATPTVHDAGLTPAPPPGGRVLSPLVRRLAGDRGVDLAEVPASSPGGVVHRADIDHLVPTAPTPVSAPAARRGPEAAPNTAVRASPMAKRLAASVGIDLARVAGGGTRGVVRAEDVRRAMSTGEPPAAQKVTAAEAPAVKPAAGAAHADTMRRAIAALMTRSNREIPHYYVSTTIDMFAATAWLRTCNRELAVTERLVPAALLLAAVARAAVVVPQLNGTWVDDEFRPASSVDLGLVVSLRRGGIMVPVITDAANRSVPQLMATMRDVVERARSGRLRSSELAPPSITVSNLGEQGVESVHGVIYPPQVALVGFGAVVERPWAVDGLLGVRPVVTATLAADHRASDGAVGARFLNRIDRLLQKPEEL